MSSIGKELFMAAHEQLIAEYMDAHPEADESKVYDLTADAAMDRMRENVADQIDYARMLAKERT